MYINLMKALLWTCLFLSHGNFAIGSDKKGCLLNEVLISDKIFPNFACWKCYENFKTNNRLVKINCKIFHDGEYSSVPGFVVSDACVPFDHRSESISELVQSSLTNVTYERWRRCCNDAMKCCDSMIANYQAENFFNSCDNHWDGSSCYADTFPGDTVGQKCPYQLIKGEKSKCQHFYKKHCRNGAWESEDYSQCLKSNRMQSNSLIHIIILSASLVATLPVLITVIVKKKLFKKSCRVIVVLMMIFAFRNLLSLVLKVHIQLEPWILKENPWHCRLVATASYFIDNFGYFYLMFTALAVNNGAYSWLNILFGLAVSLTISILWAVIMQFTANSSCWISTHEQDQNWINYSQQLFLLMPTISMFVAGICLAEHNKGNNKPGYSSKALLLCSVFFLLPFFFMFFESIFSCCGWEEAFKLLLTSFQSLQILAVILVFTFHPKVRKRWRKCRKQSRSNGSDASLAPSRTSQNTISQIADPAAIRSWDDFVIRAKNSVCDDNFYTIGPRRVVNSSPDPIAQKTRSSLIAPDLKSVRDIRSAKRRNTIRDIMKGAKNDAGTIPKFVTAIPCTSPPLPKIIPNQILDDVQLFDFYYKNLNTVFISDSPQTAAKKIPVHS